MSGPFIEPSNISCGVKELSELKAPTTCLRAVKKWYKEEKYWCDDDPFVPNAFFLFSDTIKRGKGERLANYIRDHNLGRIQQSVIRVNPNTDNLIRVWTWAVNWNAVLKWKG